MNCNVQLRHAASADNIVHSALIKLVVKWKMRECQLLLNNFLPGYTLI